MAALPLFIFSLLVSTTIAIENLQNTQVIDVEERMTFRALPRQLTTHKQFYFHVYFHEIFYGPNNTTVTSARPNSDFPNFGEISIFDVPLWDSQDANKLIARAQGASIQSDQKTIAWHLSFNIVFELPELKGSTLMVMGRALQLTTPRQYAIVGGTGVFTLAQGTIYGRMLSSTDESLWIELKIFGEYYTSVENPKW
ncbi:hypothetical protein LUZ63_000203 [Rhynchospora breviuscula]|uniref:Dirigent protein n=1 Tax=Rhynchospora breviuscula TaxID=2022672 RepID=A0A9Q0HVU7_9POAL|nr:hypothetical protein LUZ63_000203 [Rhynchospora breviuscula]